jgi:hypothetical protein
MLHIAWINKSATQWNKAEDRRKFFEEYALAHKFNPLVPKNWYSEPRERIMSTLVFFFLFFFVFTPTLIILKGAFRVLHHHNRSLAQALRDLFPDIDVDKTKFLYQGFLFFYIYFILIFFFFLGCCFLV